MVIVPSLCGSATGPLVVGNTNGKIRRVVWATFGVLLMLAAGAVTKSIVRHASNQSDLENKLSQLAESMNRSGPIFFRDGTRIERVSSGPGLRLNYYVSLTIPYDPAVLGRMKEFESLWADNICSHRTFRAAINDGVLLVYHFRYTDGATLPPITLDKESCRGITIR
jgi:hypothetical protein